MTIQECILIPTIAITNYHKLGGLKQQKFIFSPFWRLKMSAETFFLSLLVSGGGRPSLESVREPRKILMTVTLSALSVY